MTRLRVGIFGLGGIAIRHAQAVAALPGRLELVACCGRDSGRSERFAAEHGGKAYTDLDRMLDEAAPDLIIVTHPPYARAGEVERIAAAGVHLLVEKPIALNMAAATAMVDAVEASGVTAAIGFMYRHGEATRHFAMADTGPIAMMTATFQCNALHADWWRDEARSGGQIVEQVIHLIDLMRCFMEEPDTVYARRARLFHDEPGYDVEDVSAILFGWDDGRLASFSANNIAVPGIWHKEWALFGRGMTGRFANWNDATFFPTSGAAPPVRVETGGNPFEAQLLDLADAIETGRPLIAPLREGAATLRLALAARQSADERREIRLT